jgi:hypothetical protein
MSETAVNPHSLAGRDFRALFRADRPVRRIEFSVEGKPCFVALRQMGKDAYTEFCDRQETGAADAAAFLVGNTLTDCCLWTRQRGKDGSLGEWQQVRPPEGARDLTAWIESEFDALADFWTALVWECGRENQVSEDQEGNSGAPSAS